MTDKDILDRNSLPALLQQTEAEVEAVSGWRLCSAKGCARRGDTQIAEAIVRCAALNRMTSLDMPQSYAL